MESAVNFDLAHVLFMDVIGFSKLLIDEQHEVMDELNAVVRATEQFRSADENGKLISLPTGDGMALAFLERSDAPVRCAVEVARALKSHPQIQLRMGIHSGAVRGVTDVNQRANVAGAGMNTAQRVMDCGDAGHILLSQRVAEDLAQFREWKESIHDLGECEVKHGDRIRLFNLIGEGFGNPDLPKRLGADQPVQVVAKRPTIGRKGFAVAASAAFVAAVVTTWWIAEHRSPKPGKAANVPAAATDAPEKSIAVLPLENLSEDKKDAFFADGIQDDILTSLAQIADLKVISRTSVMQYRGAARSLRDIGKALGVANILEGSVRRDGNRVLVNVQLIDAQHDRHLWAERYDRTLSDSIGLQGELATEIANALKAKLAPEEKSRLATKPTANGQAYLLYLQANQLVHVAASRQEVFEADALYSQAIALDSNFALAYARASMLNSLMYYVGRDPARIIRTRALLEEALRLSPNLGEAHLAAGLCFSRIDRKYDAALKEFTLASAASPNDSEILDASGLVYRRQGRWREAIAIFQKAQVLDPRQAHFDGEPETLLALRQWPAANDAYERGLQLEPQLVDGWVGLAYVQFAQSGVASAGSTTMARAPEVVKTKGDAGDAQWDYAMKARFRHCAKAFTRSPGERIPRL